MLCLYVNIYAIASLTRWRWCTEFLRTEGLFRISGSVSEVKAIKAAYLRGEAVDLTKVTDPHAVAGVLKLFFREARDPLLTFELYPFCLACLGTYPSLHRMRLFHTSAHALNTCRDGRRPHTSHQEGHRSATADKQTHSLSPHGYMCMCACACACACPLGHAAHRH